MSTIPDPATTDWVPLQGKAGLRYVGQFTGGPYYDGDCVIGADGVLYMCVTDGTTTAPVAWPGAAAPQGPAGPQGPQGVGIPMPVVNGSWIKGVAGAAAWTALTQDQLPVNLQAQAQGLPGADYNNATSAGWYVGIPSDAHGPAGGYYCHVQVLQFGGPQYKQIAHRYDTLDIFQRFSVGGSTWQPWVQTQWTPSLWWTLGTDVGFQNGWTNYGAPFGPGRFRRLSTGLVVCEGLLQGGASVGFTFPVGYRVAAGRQLIFNSAMGAPGNAGNPESCRIDGGNFVGSSAASWISLAGIQFFAEA